MKKLAFVAGAILSLYLVPGIKDAYDTIYDSFIPSLVQVTEFEAAFLKSLPLILFGFIIIAIIWKLTRKEESE